MEQQQQIHVLSQELVLKSRRSKHYQGLLGANIFYQWQHIQAPVTFRSDGVKMLNNLINTQANSHMPSFPMGPTMSMSMRFNDQINESELMFNDDFRTPTLGVAVFHQSEVPDLFNVKGLKATLGVRLDYERMWLDYAAWYGFSHDYALDGVMKTGAQERVVPMITTRRFDVNNTSLQGELHNDYLKVLPKVALQYDFQQGNVYASVSRGYRSGGYNVQNISELLRPQMQTDMMRQVRDATIPVLEQQPMVPSETKEKVKTILNNMVQENTPDVNASCRYNPETAWNYEVGAHLNFFDRRLMMDVAAFWSDVQDLQLSQMSQTGLGRVITNAGKSRSIGIETTVRARPVNHLLLIASYGYTHATFRNYETTGDDGSTVDYKGNFVPYMPRHTLNLDASYAFPLRHRFFHTLTVGATLSAIGSIYWNEANDRAQDLYGLLGARVSLASKHLDLQLWGRNLTNTSYNTFWFASAGRGYEQHGRPLQIGIDAQIRF
ncbi:MAG: TonB-dependent receptor [Bacteroidaceae bacterium]|nr:TonB-dependent receptor [Bacteroidaceae bacterium]